MGDVLLFRWCFACSNWRVCVGTNVMYAVGFGKEYLSGSLSMRSMVHAEGKSCLGRRTGWINRGRRFCFGFFFLYVSGS